MSKIVSEEKSKPEPEIEAADGPETDAAEEGQPEAEAEPGQVSVFVNIFFNLGTKIS